MLLTVLSKAIGGAGSGRRVVLGRKKDDIGCLVVVTCSGVVVMMGSGIVLGDRFRGRKKSEMVVMV